MFKNYTNEYTYIWIKGTHTMYIIRLISHHAFLSCILHPILSYLILTLQIAAMKRNAGYQYNFTRV